LQGYGPEAQGTTGLPKSHKAKGFKSESGHSFYTTQCDGTIWLRLVSDDDGEIDEKIDVINYTTSK